jgi:VanZ family protein
VIRALIAWGPAATWATVLFLLSEFRGFTPNVWFAVHDKLVHLLLYGVLGATLSWAKRMSDRSVPHWALLSLGLAYGVVDELHQRFVPNRVSSVDDLVADAIGLVIGYVVMLLVWNVVGRFRTQPSR